MRITPALLLVSSFLGIAVPADASNACEPRIKEVFFLPDDGEVQILGRCLEDGYNRTIVRLGTEGKLAVHSQREREVIAALPPDLPDGNYRITVKHYGGKAQWLAALVAEGAQGQH